MNEIRDAIFTAASLIMGGDQQLLGIVLLSLRVSLSAVFLAALIGLPVGAVLAVCRFPARGVVIVTLNALMGLPPVVAGLFVYLLLSRSGPLGSFALLFTPGGMVIAQIVLISPIIIALTRQVVEDVWSEYRDLVLLDGLSVAVTIGILLWAARFSLTTTVLAGLGRAVAEVGAILIVGGNIAGVTRTMTTAIALETSRGDLALALGLGVILLALAIAINASAHIASSAGRRAAA